MIFISAGMAYMPHAFQVHVGAAKAGIDMLMKNLAIEWGPHGIRCNSIVPGPIEGTEGMKRLSDPACTISSLGSVPLRRMGTVDDIGQVAVLLASPLAAYVTGCVVVCDGGQNLVGSALFNLGAAKALEPKTQAASWSDAGCSFARAQRTIDRSDTGRDYEPTIVLKPEPSPEATTCHLSVNF